MKKQQPAQLQSARGGNRKVVSWPTLGRRLKRHRDKGERIVFTNGCFDLIHTGHVRYLRAARKLGDVLVVALNSDESVRRLKGPRRPLVGEADRCEVMAALEMVDYVTLFAQDTPYELIKRLRPDILVKGGDWKVADIVGADIVLAAGGKVRSLRFAHGYSTTRLVEQARK